MVRTQCGQMETIFLTLFLRQVLQVLFARFWKTSRCRGGGLDPGALFLLQHAVACAQVLHDASKSRDDLAALGS